MQEVSGADGRLRTGRGSSPLQFHLLLEFAFYALLQFVAGNASTTARVRHSLLKSLAAELSHQARKQLRLGFTGNRIL